MAPPLPLMLVLLAVTVTGIIILVAVMVLAAFASEAEAPPRAIVRTPSRRTRARATKGAGLSVAMGLLLGGAGTAEANGRFPSSVSVSFRPGDADDIYLGTTFGFLISHDDGASFRWLCEQSLGYQGTFDPIYRVGMDGTIYASNYGGLRVSRDGGCSFESATDSLPENDPGRIAGVSVEDVDVGPTGDIWVATADGARSNDVYRSVDGAHTFLPKGLRSTVIWWKSVRVSSADAQRAYVTGYQVSQDGPGGEPIPPTVHLRRTDDAGGRWEELPITAFQLGSSPLIAVAAVDPTRADVLYVRSVRAAPPEGDVLYRSIDGGRTWSRVVTTTDAIRDVVVRSSEVLVATTKGGMHRSTDDGETFMQLASAPQAACLGDRAGTLFACGTNWDPDRFSLGRSMDATAWTKVFRFIELKGPLACPAGTVQHDVCEVEQWPMLAQQFGIKDPANVDAGVDPETPTPGCCDSTGAPATSSAAGSVLVVIALLRPRRRRDARR